MNVLLTCAGRRRYLVQYFREALAGQGAVYAADCSPDAAAMLEADAAFTMPPVSDPRYRDRLLELCRQREVDLLVPLNDLELAYIAAWRPLFLEIGTTPVISSQETVATCSDKWQAYQFLTARGLPTPKTYVALEVAMDALDRGELTYPIVLKPRWGSASMWIETCADAQELELAYRLVERRAAQGPFPAGGGEDGEGCVLIQQRLCGREYGLDVVNDLRGTYVCTFARRKLAMRAGETDRAVTVEDEQLSDLGRRLGEAFAHIGNLDCDLFIEEQGPFVLEMNPRFGGGYPFSHVAGADLPAALIAWAMGVPPDPRCFAMVPGVVSAKCDQLMVRRASARSMGAGRAVAEERA